MLAVLRLKGQLSFEFCSVKAPLSVHDILCCVADKLTETRMVESSTASKFSLAKLTNQNYQPWKFKVRMLLIREGIWKYIQ
jgi:hypothetical protein